MRNRNIIASVVALVGAALTLVSPWQAWYNGRHGSTYKFYEVFGSGITASGSGIMDSVFLVFLITAVLTVVGVLLRSRVVALSGAGIAFGFTILWMVRQGQAAGELTVTGANNRGIGSGLAWAFGGSLLMIIGSLLMTGESRRIWVADRTTPRAAADQGTSTRASTTSALPAITTTAAASTSEPTTQESKPTAERTGTERLSKEERQMLGLDEDASAEPKKQN